MALCLLLKASQWSTLNNQCGSYTLTNTGVNQNRKGFFGLSPQENPFLILVEPFIDSTWNSFREFYLKPKNKGLYLEPSVKSFTYNSL